MIWFGLVLWHINHCRLFNAISSLYIYIKYIWFGLVGFYGISTIVGYLMPNPFYTKILNIWYVNIFSGKILKRAWALSCTQLNGFKYCYKKIAIQHQSFVCAHSLFYLAPRQDTNGCYSSRSYWTREQCQWRGTRSSQNLEGWTLP